MKRFNLWEKYIGTSTGWGKAAKVNCALLVSLSIVLSIGFALTVVRTKDFLRALLFYEAPCAKRNIPIVNLILHLLINVVSTLVVKPLSQSCSNSPAC
ncbi:hypothetical protein F4679DRAFT_297192 [Xylaria curta]|nr:hypothetical protein F4679DRAFT_297192 [Xylaria curta]